MAAQIELKTARRLTALCGVVAVVLGCGAIVDKDNIRIARIGDTYITRGALNAVIRDMPAEERPNIRTKGDVLKTLQAHIDFVLKSTLAARLDTEGKLHVPREWAEQQYYAAHPEQRNMDIQDPEAAGFTQQQVDVMKEERELAIDRLHEKLRAEGAVLYRVQEEIKNGMKPAEEEFQNEFEFRRDQLKNLEAIVFRGVYFPASQEDAIGKAAKLRERLKAGEKLDDLITEYTTTQGGHPLESGIENDPTAPKFFGFWQQASGAKVGDVIGPVFIQGWGAVRQGAGAKQGGGQTLPDSYLVCVVVEYAPESPKTFEQAKPDLLPPICYAKVMDQLRTENNVEIYEDKLPNPSIYDENRATSIFDQQKK